MKIAHPAPFYRLLYAQLWLLAAVASLWLHWHVIATGSYLTHDYPLGKTWWYVLEWVLRLTVLPILTSLLFATASFVLDRKMFTGLSLLAGPAIVVAQMLVFETTTYQQWIVIGAALLAAAHYLPKFRTYWATLMFWMNQSDQREQVLSEYNDNIHSLVTALSADQEHLLPEELAEFQSLHPDDEDFHHIFAPSTQEAKSELHATIHRLSQFLKAAYRRRDEPIARRRRTLKKRQTQLRPLYEAHCKKNQESYGRYVWSLGFDLFEQQLPTADRWRVLSSDKINFYADSVQQFFVDSATETGGEAANVRTRTENLLRIHYMKHIKLVGQHLDRSQLSELLAEARQLDDVNEYVDHILAIHNRISVLSIRQKLMNYYQKYAAVLSDNLPRSEFDRQLDELINHEYALKLVESHEEELRTTLETFTEKTREEIERREELLTQQRRQELRVRFEAVLLSNLQRLQHLTAEIKEAERADITPTDRHDFITDCKRDIDSVESQLAVFRDEDPDLFDEIRQQLDQPVVAA